MPSHRVVRVGRARPTQLSTALRSEDGSQSRCIRSGWKAVHDQFGDARLATPGWPDRDTRDGLPDCGFPFAWSREPFPRVAASADLSWLLLLPVCASGWD